MGIVLFCPVKCKIGCEGNGLNFHHKGEAKRKPKNPYLEYQLKSASIKKTLDSSVQEQSLTVFRLKSITYPSPSRPQTEKPG